MTTPPAPGTVPASSTFICLAQRDPDEQDLESDWTREETPMFTLDLDKEWLLPGVPPTGRRLEVAVVVIISFEGAR